MVVELDCIFNENIIYKYARKTQTRTKPEKNSYTMYTYAIILMHYAHNHI